MVLYHSPSSGLFYSNGQRRSHYGIPRTNAPPTLAAFVKTATRGEALTHTYIVSIRFLDHAKKTPKKYSTLTASIGSLIMSLYMP